MRCNRHSERVGGLRHKGNLPRFLVSGRCQITRLILHSSRCHRQHYHRCILYSRHWLRRGSMLRSRGRALAPSHRRLAVRYRYTWPLHRSTDRHVGSVWLRRTSQYSGRLRSSRRLCFVSVRHRRGRKRGRLRTMPPSRDLRAPRQTSITDQVYPRGSILEILRGLCQFGSSLG